MIIDLEDLKLCEDCMQYAVNGDLPPDNTARQDRLITEGVATLGQHLVPDFGEQPKKFECDECEEVFGDSPNIFAGGMCMHCITGRLRDITRDNGEDEFSRCTCYACGTTLAGARYRFATLKEEEKA